MATELVRQLVDAGVHFGHRASRWNPKMSPYIFGKRNTIHIIDIRETLKGLVRAQKFLARTVASGLDVLFVGTKRQARLHIREQSNRVHMPFVAERWLGGTLTNFRTIRSRLGRLDELEAAETNGSALQYSKKMIASRSRELRKIRRNLEGIRLMERLPGALVVIDVHREKNAVREARILGIPTVCLIDTDSDPDFADVPIPGNDDAMRSIELILTKLTDAIEMGIKGRMAKPQEDTGASDARRSSARPATARAEGDGRPEGGSEGATPPLPSAAPSEDGLAGSAAATAGLTPAAASEQKGSP